MFDYPTGAILGAEAGLTLLIVAGITFWRRSSTQPMPAIVRAIILAATGGTVMVISVMQINVEMNFHKEVAKMNSNIFTPGPMPHASYAMVTAVAISLVVLVGVLIDTIARRRPIQTTAAIMALTATFALLATVTQFVAFNDGWALLKAVGWIATGFALVIFVATTAMVQIRAYGHRQFMAGQAAGLRMPVEAPTS